jgi:hypothetical protein
VLSWTYLHTIHTFLHHHLQFPLLSFVGIVWELTILIIYDPSDLSSVGDLTLDVWHVLIAVLRIFLPWHQSLFVERGCGLSHWPYVVIPWLHHIVSTFDIDIIILCVIMMALFCVRLWVTIPSQSLIPHPRSLAPAQVSVRPVSKSLTTRQFSKHYFPLLEHSSFDPRTVHPLTSRCTNWATWPTKRNVRCKKHKVL